MTVPHFHIFSCSIIPVDAQIFKSSSKVAAFLTTPLTSVQTGSIGPQVAKVSLQSTASGLVIEQRSFLFNQ